MQKNTMLRNKKKGMGKNTARNPEMEESTGRTKAFLVAPVLASLTEPVHHSSSTTTATTVAMALVCVTEFAVLL